MAYRYEKIAVPPPEKILATGLGGALIESRKGCPVPCLFYFNCLVSYGPSLGLLYLLICCSFCRPWLRLTGSIGRSVRSTTASVIVIPATTPPLVILRQFSN